MRMKSRLLIYIMTLILFINQIPSPAFAAQGKTDLQTTASSVTKVLSYANQLKKASSVNTTKGNMGWDTEKKSYSWAYFNGLMLDAFMMVDASGNSSYVQGFYTANINNQGKIVNLEDGSPAKGALDNIEPMRAGFDLLSGSQSALIKKGIQELYSQLEAMTTYSNCGGNYVHKQNTDGTPTSSWAEYPVALDGLYMAQPFLMECANKIDSGALTLKDKNGRTVTSESLYTAVYNRFVWIYQNLYNPSTGLFDHAYSPSIKKTNGVSWTRAIGWYAMALVDVIDMMPAGSRKSTLIAELPRLFDGMLRYQDQDTGLWYNVTAYTTNLNEKNILETSGTAMMAYSLFKAYQNGWVTDQKYAEAGLKGFNGIVANKMTGSSGNYSVIDTYRSSGASTVPSYYTNAPYTTNEAKGVGPLIMAATMANAVATKFEKQQTDATESEGSNESTSEGSQESDSQESSSGNEESGSQESSSANEESGSEESSGQDSGETEESGSQDSGSGNESGDGGNSGSGNESGEGGNSGSGNETEDPLTIVIHDRSGKAANTFEAYQIFTGKLTDSASINATIAWGNGIRTENGKLEVAGHLYTALELVRAYTNRSVSVEDLLSAIEANLSDTSYVGHKSATLPDILITLPAPGYYFIRNTEGSAADGEAYTRFLLHVIGSDYIRLNAKADAPYVDKKVKNDGEAEDKFRDANNGKNGDLINYRIESNVPDMSEYKEYRFQIHDTMCPGLTYQEGSLTITLSGKTLQPEKDYTASIRENEQGETLIDISFHEFIQYKGQIGSVINVNYDAMINEQAITGAEGNPNAVYLTYSNDPNHQGDGTTGKTPVKWVKTYLARLLGYKFDGKDGKALSGATFTLTGTQKNCYYTDEDGILQETHIDKTVMSGTDGYADFGTLGEGTYQITEIKAPDGYNMLTRPIDVEIQCNSDTMQIFDGSEQTNWTVTVDGKPLSNSFENKLLTVTADSSVFLFEIQNQSGSLLPSTGGPGNTGLYLAGAALLLLGIMLLGTKRFNIAKKA